MEQNTIDALKAGLDAAGVPYREQEPLSAHTTFKIGGPAAFFVRPAREEELCKAVTLCKSLSVPYYILGNGSNILFGDKGWNGAVICLAGMKGEIQQEGETLRAPAGMPLSMLCMAALQAGLTGLEFAYGIPGTVGGAIYMNAGAYGGEMKDVLVSVRHLTAEGEIVETPAAELDLSYRHSIFEDNGDCILSAQVRLTPGDPQKISDQMNELMGRRRDKQPLDSPAQAAPSSVRWVRLRAR